MSLSAQADMNQEIALWNHLIANIKEELSRGVFLSWFKPLRFHNIKENTIIIGASSNFGIEWLESHYKDLLTKNIHSVFGDEYTYRFEIYNPDNAIEKPKPIESVANSTSKPEAEHVAPKKQDLVSRLNPDFRFDNYIEGDCNKVARAAAYSILNNNGSMPIFNPILIHGGPGLGKTHLIQAIGNGIIQGGIGKRVLYATSEDFMRDFIGFIKSGENNAFAKLYRTVDVLLLDDVQYFMTREKTQEEFFHTFNALHNSGKQLVFSSDRPPAELVKFDERMISRLQSGLTVEIRNPDLETRIAILKKMADEQNSGVDDEVIHFIASHVTDNVRTLLGAYTQLVAQKSLLRIPITMELAVQTLKALKVKIQNNITVEYIQDVTSDFFNINSDELRSKSRHKEITEPRMIAMYLSIEMTQNSLKTIGLKFGGRDHTTVIHARNTITNKLKSDVTFFKTVTTIKEQIERKSF